MHATDDDEREAAELVAECQRPSVQFDAGPPFRLRPARDRSLQYAAAGVFVLAFSAVLVVSVAVWAAGRL